MNIISVVGVCIVATAVSILLKQYKPEFSMMVSLGCGVIVFFTVIFSLSPAFDTIQDLMQKVSLDSNYTKVLIKALGICYITQLASDTCKDSGQTAIASKVELAGKVAIILISLPLFTILVDTALNLINIG
jgi:stage III sporulation protein AD